MSLRVQPVDFNQDGSPRDPRLYGAVQEYAKSALGEELFFAYYAKVWATVLCEDGGKMQIIGLLGTRAAIDVCMFHVTPPSQDREGMRVAEAARDAMHARMRSYLEDLGHTGNIVLVYVSETAERFWRRFLGKIGARPANRYEIKV